ncbi:MAG: hypothetical protein ACLFT6_01820 [Bacteroidales bacterium]
MADKNDNGIPDKWETYFTYLVATLALVAAFTQDVSDTQIVYLFVIAAVLTGERDLLPYLTKRR